MTPPTTCSRCGADLPDPSSRQCPACLLALAVESHGADDPTRTADLDAFDGGGGPAPQLAPGRIFGAYRIERLLGKGGMGEVYEAEQLEHGRRVALKVVSRKLSTPADRERFLREGQLAASVTHPKAVYIFGSEEIEGAPAITMELLAGGTLKDRVEREGPMAAAEAVDAILQVIAGLDAAHQAGILHRDVKPSNCFVDVDGTIKIGDFGLSISTMARHPELTEAGAIHGTPQFAAPEQLRGEPLDVRADIYAVGATLFYLLTGRPPFEAPTLGALLTQVATTRAAFPKGSRVGAALAAVALRCLAKRPEDRPDSYRALHEALAPYGLEAPQPSGVLSRICAFYVDTYIVSLAALVIREAASLERSAVVELEGGSDIYVFFAGNLTLGVALLYFAVVEAFAGRSVGKAVFGLQFTTPDGTPATKPAIALRAAMFIAVVFVARQGRGAFAPPWVLAFTGFWPVALVAFITARRGNGFAGVHDLLTGTRVTRRRGAAISTLAAARQDPFREAAAVPSAARSHGPFVVLDPVATVDGAAVSRGWDRTLRRRVWIVETPPGSPLFSPSRRAIGRPTRLRWIAGRAEPTGTWQVFAVPPGEPFLDAIRRHPSWDVVRSWLASLAGELSVATAAGELPTLRLDRVWVTPAGTAIVADFPVKSGDPEHRDDVSAASARRPGTFVGTVAASAIAGSLNGELRQNAARARPPLPMSDRAALEALAGVEDPGRSDLDDLQRTLLTPRAHVSAQARLAVPGVLVVILASFVLYGVSGQSRQLARMNSQWILFNGMLEIARLERSGVPPSAPEREALELYLAGLYPGNLRAAAFLDLELFATAGAIETRRGAVSAAEMVAAAERLGPATLDRLNRPPPSRPVHKLARTRLRFLAVFGAIAVLAALVFREGPVLRAMNVAIVGDDGTQVSRWRATWRALIAWSPVLVHALITPPVFLDATVWPSLIALAVLSIGAAGVWTVIATPHRALHDRLAGTWLVPR